MMATKLRKLFPRARRRRVAIVLLVLLSAQTALFILTYRAAVEHLRRHDPRQLQNRAEISFFYAPPKLRVDAHEKREDLIAYVRELGYEERDDNALASYFVKGETLNLTSRLPSFQTLSITFARERISRISVAGVAREEAELEPLPMQNFVRYLKDDSLAEQRIRRTVIAAGSVPAMLSDAVTSAEDKRFFEHHGIDVFGIVWRVANKGRRLFHHAATHQEHRFQRRERRVLARVHGISAGQLAAQSDGRFLRARRRKIDDEG